VRNCYFIGVRVSDSIGEPEPVPSIVIPAHNEADSIERLLCALAPMAHETEIVVVCNGCTDDTAARARLAAPWADVIELEEASKTSALDAGDAAGTTFPRAYIDADVDTNATAIRTLFAALHDGVLAVAATPVYDLSSSSFIVRSHYAIWSHMVAKTEGIAGTGAMVISAQARARFQSWPRLIGDDYFLDGQFDSSEKRRIPSARVVIAAPRGLRDCVARKARVHQGNAQVRDNGLRSPHQGGGLRGALAVVRARPTLAVYLPTHILVTATARVFARWRQWRGTQFWYRDRGRAAT
jgi:glycosyltransferase involved in cell wall biosynthesis